MKIRTPKLILFVLKTEFRIRTLLRQCPDLCLNEEGILRADRSQVKSFKPSPALSDKELTDIIKDTYRVLLTRGMKKCSIYCCDERLRQYFLEKG